MADTWTCNATNVAWASAKNMLSFYNDASTTAICRIYKIWMVNTQTAAVTGTNIVDCFIYRFSAGPHSGGTALGTANTPVPTAGQIVAHRSSNAAIPAQFTIRTGATGGISLGALVRGFLRCSDEAASQAAITLDEVQAIYPLNLVWDAGYGESDIQPLTLRATEGMVIRAGTNGSFVGQCDINVLFTLNPT